MTTTLDPWLIGRIVLVAATLAVFVITPRGGAGHPMEDPGDGWEPYVANEQILYRPSPGCSVMHQE